MKMYSPPFSITNEMVSLISEISDKLGRISNYKEFESKPHLRRNNRIKSIHSSLAIEANSLSMDEVRAVVNGKTVIGPQKEIQEVKNAYAAYEQIGSFDPYSVEELKRLHGLFTKYTVDESGAFRRGEEGVFDGDRCIFMAPPAHLVPQLMDVKKIPCIRLSYLLYSIMNLCLFIPSPMATAEWLAFGRPRSSLSGSRFFSICL